MKSIICVISVFLAFIISGHVFAQRITNANGSDVEMDVTNLADLSEGSKLYSIGKDGKKKALIEVEMVDDTTATGKVTKGKAEKGQRLILANSEVSNSKNFQRNGGSFFQQLRYGVGGRYVNASKTIPGVTVDAGFGTTTTTPSVTANASGFTLHSEAMYFVTKDIQVGGEFKFSSLDWGGGSTSTILDIGALGKYKISSFSILFGFTPITNISNSSGGSTSATTLILGGGYQVIKQLDAIFEYRMIATSGSTINPMYFGANYYF